MTLTTVLLGGGLNRRGGIFVVVGFFLIKLTFGTVYGHQSLNIPQFLVDHKMPFKIKSTITLTYFVQSNTDQEYTC